MAQPSRDTDAGTAIREFGAALRRCRDERNLTQLDVATRLEVTRATLSQWETGRHLPSAENAAQLDGLLATGGELTALADAARSAAGEAPADVARMSLREAQARVGQTLVERLKQDPVTGTVGWSHDLDDELPPTPLSSAFAAKALALVEAPYLDLAPVADTLMRRREPDGGWGPRRMRARPESSAIVLDALTRIGARIDVDAELEVIERLIDEAGRSGPKPSPASSTYVLASVLEVVARVRPGSPFADRVTEMLLDLQRESGWPEKKVTSPVRSQLSTAHTARAVIALAVVRDTGTRDARLRGRAGRAVGLAIDWLQRFAHEYPVRENLYAIDRSGEIGDLEIRHMTPALIARALALAEEPGEARIQRALELLWAQYDRRQGLWTWPNGDVPLWLQYEAVAATRVAYGRTTTVSVPRT